jgi:hypothetical protein
MNTNFYFFLLIPTHFQAAEACNMKLREYSTMKDNLSTSII